MINTIGKLIQMKKYYKVHILLFDIINNKKFAQNSGQI